MQINILSTSDVHGNIYPTNFSTATDHQPFGYLKAASVINQVREDATDDDIVLYVENGDFIQGAAMATYAWETRDEQHYDQMFGRLTNFLKPDAGVLGNHEFNYGQNYLKRVLKNTRYPVLSANIGHALTHGIADSPYTMVCQNGVKIAILGLTTMHIPHWEPADNIAGLTFNSALEAAKKWVPRLKKMADVVVVAYHGGFERDLDTDEPTEKFTGENEAAAILSEVPGIDAMITGHQHRQIATSYHGVPVTQPGYRGEFVGQITLTLDEDKQVTESKAELLPVGEAPANKQLQVLTQDWKDDVEHWLDQPLATVEGGDMLIDDHLKARLYGHPLLDLINKVAMDATDTDIAATPLFNDEVRGFDRDITMRNVINGYVFPNTLVVEEVTGADLKAALEHCAGFFNDDHGKVSVTTRFTSPKSRLFNYDYYSGIDYTFDLTKPEGQRVAKLEYHGKPVTDNQVLTVTLNQYRGMGAGGYEMYSNDKIIRNNEEVMPNLIADYLKKHPIIVAEQPTNLTIIK